MNINVHVKDSTNGFVWQFDLTSQDEILVNDFWINEDKLLIDLSGTEPFKNKTTWDSLELKDYHILLLHCFSYFKTVNDINELSMIYEEPFLSFKFLVAACVKRMTLDGNVGFETIFVERTADDKLFMETKTSYWFSFVDKPKILRPGLRLVIDNDF